MNWKQLVVIAIGSVILWSCGGTDNRHTEPEQHLQKELTNEELVETFINDTTPEFFERMGEPMLGDWLSEHEEEGQDYMQYLNADPKIVDDKRNTIYLQPLGEFNKDDSLLLDATSEYLRAFYGLPVVVKEGISSDVIPESSQRVYFDKRQLHTKYILYEILKPNLPDDAVALMAITPIDLYPKESWNFVFGQASTKSRVGVSSLNRHKQYDEVGNLNFELAFKRISKTSSHEIGHMLTLKHCIEYKCCMNGSNYQEESDNKPMWLCPQCLDKMRYAIKQPIKVRLARLEEFYAKHGFKEETHYSNLLELLSAYNE